MNENTDWACRQGGAGRGVQARGCRQGGAGKGVQARGVGQARNFNQRGCRLLLPEVQGMHARGIRKAIMHFSMKETL